MWQRQDPILPSREREFVHLKILEVYELSFQISRHQAARQSISSFLRVPPSIRFWFLSISASSIQPIQEGMQHQSATCLLRGANETLSKSVLHSNPPTCRIHLRMIFMLSSHAWQ